MPSSLQDLLLALELYPPVGPGDGNNIDTSVVDNNTTKSVPTTGRCVNQFIDYVTEYYNALLDKSNDTTFLSSSSNTVKTYKIEEMSSCVVAELAGLFDEETTVYLPNYAKINRKCAARVDSSTGSDTAVTDAAARKLGLVNASIDDNETRTLKNGIWFPTQL